MPSVPTCPDCKVTMEGGFLPDHGSSASRPVAWIEGAPEKNFWGYMQTKGRREFVIYGWRCPNCSLVRLYAPDDEQAVRGIDD